MGVSFPRWCLALTATLTLFPLHSARADILVSDFADGNVQRYNDVTGAYVGTVATGIGRATGLAYGQDGTLYVGDFDGSTIQLFDGMTGAYLRQIRSGFGGISQPTGITFDANWNLYIAGYGSNAVYKYDRFGALIGAFPTGINHPYDLAVSGGFLYVTSPTDNKFNIYNTTSGALANFGDASAPYGLSFDKNGSMWIANSGLNEVDGPHQIKLPQLTVAHGLKVYDDGRVFIADNANHRIFTWSAGNLTVLTNAVNSPNFLLKVPVFADPSTPTSINEHSTATGTVTLSTTSTTDTVVTLTGGPSYAISIPASVTVPAGHTSATFPITTYDSNYVDGPTISASVNGYTRTFKIDDIADTTPPVTTIIINGQAPATHWYSSNIVSLTTESTGITWHQIDDAPAHTDAEAFEVTGQGTHTITYWSIDYHGNEEAHRSVTIKVDQVPPVTTARVSSTSGAVTLTATDDLSGVGGTDYMVDSGPWLRYTAPIITDTSGPHTITYYSWDVAGSVDDLQTLSIVVPSRLQKITPATSPVTGGVDVPINIQLDGPAPSKGTVVTLSTDNPAAYFSTPSVTVPAGSTTTIATLHTSGVTTKTAVVITGKAALTHTTHLTIVPPIIYSLRFDPSSLGGGAPSVGTVTLTGPAAVDTNVTLASSNPSIVSVPASVLVPAGSTTGTFNITTSPVDTATTVTISATFDGTTKPSTMTVHVPYLSSLGFSLRTTKGGSKVTLTVTLQSPSPAGGTNVAVTYTVNGSNLASPPASIFVPAGALSGSALISTTTVTSATTVTATANANGSTKGASVTLTP